MRKVGIMSMQRIANYGSFLQASASEPERIGRKIYINPKERLS